jgi:secreted trypsin-like serine protease
MHPISRDLESLRANVTARLLAFLSLALFACAVPAVSAVDSMLTASVVPAVAGIADQGMDPAVVAVLVGDAGACSGVLIAPDVVLTARHCTAKTVSHVACPSGGPQVVSQLDPSSFRILVGEDVATGIVVAEGESVVVPTTDILCGADIALLLLDRPIDSVKPAGVQAVGVAQGQHVRTVGYGRASAGAPSDAKLLREHVEVIATSATEFQAREAACLGDVGGPAFDEETGQVVGILSRGSPSCEATSEYDVYTRADAFYSLVEQALLASVDAGKKPTSTTEKDPTDIGGVCFTGSDCGAGVCVDDGASEYCSQSCAPTDRCPTDFACVAASSGDLVCVRSPG